MMTNTVLYPVVEQFRMTPRIENDPASFVQPARLAETCSKKLADFLLMANYRHMQIAESTRNNFDFI
jgi:hypothetical protein